MGGDSDEEDSYQFYGTKIAQESQSHRGQYRKEPAKDAGSTRQLPEHKQV